jgi:hypothetical protein
LHKLIERAKYNKVKEGSKSNDLLTEILISLEKLNSPAKNLERPQFSIFAPLLNVMEDCVKIEI